MSKQAPKSAPKAEKPAEEAPESAAEKQTDAQAQEATVGNTQTLPESLPAATETVRVKFLRSHPALAYHPGEEADLPQDLYHKYLEAGPFFEKI